jgi:hypothetical protein
LPSKRTGALAFRGHRTYAFDAGATGQVSF